MSPVICIASRTAVTSDCATAPSVRDVPSGRASAVTALRNVCNPRRGFTAAAAYGQRYNEQQPKTTPRPHKLTLPVHCVSAQSGLLRVGFEYVVTYDLEVLTAVSYSQHLYNSKIQRSATLDMPLLRASARHPRVSVRLAPPRAKFLFASQLVSLGSELLRVVAPALGLDDGGGRRPMRRPTETRVLDKSEEAAHGRFKQVAPQLLL
jgi:hypothetical protein